MKNLSRRDFIKLGAAAGVMAAGSGYLVPLAEAAAGPGRFSETRLKMGTTVAMTLVTDSRDQARTAMEAAFAEMDRLSAIFDRHKSNTVLSHLNTQKHLNGPPPELTDVLNRAAMVYRQTEGAFDPTILPLLTLLQDSFKHQGRPPETKSLKQALDHIGFERVTVSKNKVSMPEGEMSLDGVAKGYIVDAAAAKLREHGVNRALINAGGDILALGQSHRNRPWRIAIQDPFHRDRYLRIIALTDGSIATSGSYEIYYDKKKQFHHLLNPATGSPAGQAISASVVTKSTAMADAMSTAAFVNPALARKIKQDTLVVTPQGRQIFTGRFKKLLV
jgi:thiamine biosynthesis lipoprotein